MSGLQDGPQLPCQTDPDRWFADASTMKGKQLVLSAISGCKTCPALAGCMKHTEKVKPKFGVWAGRYYTQPPRLHQKAQQKG